MRLIGAIFAVATAVVTIVMAAPSTRPSAPDTIVLNQLMKLYEPVPFDHKNHAKMAEMWDGCVTCHHREPNGATRPAATTPHTQENAGKIPACKECHPLDETKAEIHMPSLKGAYHRQCLNCHREWSGQNDCVICHRPRDEASPGKVQPTRDDIIGRMHPPLPAPDEKSYVARFTPADGANVLFRHKEHAKSYGLKCASCHMRDGCGHCHEPGGDKPERKILKPGETWKQSHGACMDCHQDSRCKSCHYKEGKAAPPPFAHQSTGQMLDEDHEKLTCFSCHTHLRDKSELTCGGTECHKAELAIAYPNHRPGKIVPKPATLPVVGPMKGVRR
jgi:hypothetical protein